MQIVRHLMDLLIRSTALVLLCSINMNAQPISVRVSVGAVYLPFSAWSTFSSQIANSFYSKNNPNFEYGLSIYYAVNSNHFINIGTELIRSNASDSDPVSTVDWKFQGIPITLGYEYRALRFSDRFTPMLGAGISYFISQVTGHDNVFNQTGTRYGDGYGVHASLGLISELTQTLSMVSQLRYRYSDGMAFTDHKGDVKVEFTGFDFSTGLSWNF